MSYLDFIYALFIGIYRSLVSFILHFVGLGVVKDNSVRYWDGTRFLTLYLPRERKSVIVVEMRDEALNLDYSQDLLKEVANWNLGVPMTVSRALEILKVDPIPKELCLVVMRDGSLVNFKSEAPHASPL